MHIYTTDRHLFKENEPEYNVWWPLSCFLSRLDSGVQSNLLPAYHDVDPVSNEI